MYVHNVCMYPHEHHHFLLLFLQVINPHVRYAPDPLKPETKINGVAIILKELLTALDDRGITHPSEI